MDVLYYYLMQKIGQRFNDFRYFGRLYAAYVGQFHKIAWKHFSEYNACPVTFPSYITLKILALVINF